MILRNPKPPEHFTWAKTEDEARELEALGWRFAAQRPTHHHFHACLMRWAGKGEPVTNP